MEYLLKLAFIMILLHNNLLQLMHFNDLHLLFTITPKCLILIYLTVNFMMSILLFAFFLLFLTLALGLNVLTFGIQRVLNRLL